MSSRTTKKPRPKGTAPYDYVDDRRGYFATVVNVTKHAIILTEYPATLLSIGRAGLLTGEALKEYEALVHVPMPGVSEAVPHVPSQDRHHVVDAGHL